MKNNKGFTLIELLVVVLIIGILAAIALPQYTKTVEKSRAAEALLNLKAISDAANRFYLMNNTYNGIDISATGNLDIEPPATTATSKFDYVATPASPTTTLTITAYRRVGTTTGSASSKQYSIAFVLTNGATTSRTCAVGTGDANICKALNIN
ncbi:PilE-like protein [Elusimicrobium minutum Pei191]|uniref:PilE-like protein n=1 Tax=Elusimicrobium minutum (strain Pei191) TaxID=445932 RepID=B2KE84_ELUMP|nr:prepilin-type N-terminal cleavage/methylation domain-containing protein [Elusimicrobium minutum]ACC98830.1 PilE-like protein [Elusimicrobium minutum Pei191]